MYIDLEPSDNLPEAVMATFSETGPASPVQAIKLWRDGVWAWCAVTGWSEDGPVPALIQPIEESGDGPARLVHGGPHGLRLAALASPEATVRWDLADGSQWSEGFLLVTPEAEWR
jgi:hypothetical protein